MTIEVCGWRLEPNQSNGKRCWSLFHGKSRRPERFYDDLGKALRFVAEHELRNGEADDGEVLSIGEALGRYEAIAERIEQAVAQPA